MFESLELFAVDGDVCFAAGDCAAAIGYAARDADSDVLHPQAWLVAADARARRHAARVVKAQTAGDFTRRYVSIDSVDLGDDDAASSGADSDYSSSSSSDSDDSGSSVHSRGRTEEDEGAETRGRARRHSSGRRRETTAADSGGEEEDGGARTHDQYDLIALMAAREDREREAGAPAAKRARDDSPGAARIAVAASAVDTAPRPASLWLPAHRSALLDSMLAATPATTTTSSSGGAVSVALPEWSTTAKEKDDDTAEDSVAVLAPAMPPIGESLGDQVEAQREARRRRHEKAIRCDVAARVQELLMPYYKARRFANKVWGCTHIAQRAVQKSR